MKYNKNEVTGKMRDRIILQNVTRSRSLTGFASESWADTTTIWAFAESKLPGSNETIIEGKNTAKNICDFTIRYISSITEESRVVFKNKIYQVKNIKISHDRRFISFQGVYYDSYSTVIGLQSCSASLLAQSSLLAALMRVIKYQSSLNAFGSVTADINFVQKAQASLTGAGTTAADLTVTSAASLLLDLYPSAAAAYSLRKLRTAYTGSAIRARANTSGAEGDVSFDVNNTISASSTVTVTAVGTSGLSIGQQVTFSTFWNAGGSNQNVFVTTWYDQSGNARDAIQTTQANQPQIVSSGIVLLQGSKPAINLNGTSNSLNMININNIISSINHFNSFGVYFNIENVINTVYESIFGNGFARILHQYSRVNANRYGIGGRRVITDTFNYNESSSPISNFVLISNIIKYASSDLFVYQNGINVVSNVDYQSNGLTDSESTDNFVFFARNIGSLQYFKGSVSEIIIYTNDKSSDRINIESNINTHYGIY